MALPSVLTPFSVTGKVETSQRSFIFGLMVVFAIVFVLVLPLPWVDLDLGRGAEALRETGVFWASVRQAYLEFYAFVRGKGGALPAFLRDADESVQSSEPETGTANNSAEAGDEVEQPFEQPVMNVCSMIAL
jgi:hypothetical protein